MAGLKCSPLCRFQDKGRHLQVHRECLQDHREIIQSICQHLPAQLLHLTLLLAHLVDTPLASRTKRFQPPAEPRKTHVAGIADLPPLPELSYDRYDAAEESDDTLDLGGAEGRPPISLKQREFSLKQFSTGMGQANYSAFNKWKKVCVAGFLQKKQWSIIRGQNRVKQD